MKTDADPLAATLTTATAQRLAAGDWTVVALAGDEALTPIASYLEETFDIESVEGYAVIVVRCEPRKHQPVAKS